MQQRPETALADTGLESSGESRSCALQSSSGDLLVPRAIQPGARPSCAITSAKRHMRTWVGDSWDLDFEPPPGITFRRIDPTTGQLATQHCDEEEIAAFLEGTEPQEGCSDHRRWWCKRRAPQRSVHCGRS